MRASHIRETHLHFAHIRTHSPAPPLTRNLTHTRPQLEPCSCDPYTLEPRRPISHTFVIAVFRSLPIHSSPSVCFILSYHARGQFLSRCLPYCASSCIALVALRALPVCASSTCCVGPAERRLASSVTSTLRIAYAHLHTLTVLSRVPLLIFTLMHTPRPSVKTSVAVY